MSERAFKNPFLDYDGSSKIFDFSKERLNQDIEENLLKHIYTLISNLEKCLKSDTDWHNTSVYTGVSGIALLYLRLFQIKFSVKGNESKDYIKDALRYVEPILSQKHKTFSFLCGSPGPLAIAAVLFHIKNMEKEADECVKICESFHVKVCDDEELPDELLYGRCGYLYALLFLEKHFSSNKIRRKIIQKVVQSIITSGQFAANRSSCDIPLYYEWHDKAYVGAAHGFIGILYMLLQAREFLTPEQLQTLVRPSIDFVLSLQMPSGNFPSSLGNTSDRLYHWCHGAPGCIHLLLLAYEVFQEDQEKYMQAAIKCSDCIWEKGLLQKGYGLCHGAAGNGYAHLHLFQLTRNPKYLHRSLKFAEWCFDYGKHGCRIADRPLSLFEGLAGTIYYLVDLINPLHSAFPAFQLF